MTEWAKKFIADYNRDKHEIEHITVTDLFYVLSDEIGYSSAFTEIYGHRPLEHFGTCWEKTAIELHQSGKPVKQIAELLRCVFSPRHPTESEIRRLVSPEARDRQKKYDLAYYYRNREACKAAMRARYHRLKKQSPRAT